MCLQEEEQRVVKYSALKLIDGKSAAGNMKPVTLKRNKEFGFAYRKGKGVGAKFLVCICAKSRISGLRVGFVVSSKIGNAVKRNLVRRRLREAYRKLLPRLEGNYSIVFVAKTGIADRSFDEIVADMKYLLRKQGLIKVSEK